LAQAEGVRALWSGLLPRLVWSATFFAVGMSAYELSLTSVLSLVHPDVADDPRRGGMRTQHKGGGRETGGGGIGGRVASAVDPRQIPELIRKLYQPDVDSHVLITR
jgi:hypothetical protein